MEKNTKKSGFSLLELVIYMAIACVILVAGVNLAVTVNRGQANAQGQHEIYINARLVMYQLETKIKEADNVNTESSVFNTNPGVLNLDYPGEGTDVIIDTYEKNIVEGGQERTVRKLRIKEGSADYKDLTVDNLEVVDFTVTNLTRSGARKNIGIRLELKAGKTDIVFDTCLSIRK